MSGDGPSKISGDAKWATGVVKENVGHVLGNEQMKADGTKQKTEGDAEYKAAQAKGYAEGAKDDLVGGVKKNVAKVTGNDESEAKSKPLSAYVHGACPSLFPDYHVCTMIDITQH
eukprot:jgi/Astpho2/2230/Aster-03212